MFSKTTHATTILLVLLVLMTGSLQAQPSVEKRLWGKKVKGLPTDKEALRFIVVGDWGRDGQGYQQEVADWMGIAADQTKAGFVVSTGDNIYPRGVASVDDPQWMFSFENIYRCHSLNIPWYSSLGNHDYAGNVQAQIDYSQKSRRWVLPARYYTFVKNNVRFVVLDTPPLVKNYYKSTKYPDLAQQDSTQQLQWMDSVLTESEEDWKVVIGHHPVYTTGPREHRQEVSPTVQALLEKHKVQAYFAGHEHSLQHNYIAKAPVHYFVSGAGGEYTPVNESADFTLFSKETAGFMQVHVKKDKMQVWFINEKGKIIYQTTISQKSKLLDTTARSKSDK